MKCRIALIVASTRARCINPPKIFKNNPAIQKIMRIIAITRNIGTYQILKQNRIPTFLIP